jgi:hypothetical protein
MLGNEKLLATRMLSRISVVSGRIFNAIVTQMLLKCGETTTKAQERAKI